ncbi:hypothetical protein [Methanobrevibacter arboriphilus]|uniref:hypothetical protein n=1 Tax=Methanobrevibacter arboriphilus TaxID=39441 RepID=UPI000A567ADA|nr:hypothetical protein [Methanobrevibacter arboriphilus]
MAYDNKNPYQRVNDGVYDSYLNSAIMLPTMFNMVGQVNIPSQFENNVFNNTETVQKALFLDITLVNNTTINNGNTLVGVNDNSFTLNTKVVLSLFKNWNKIQFEGTNVNNLTITLKDNNNTTIRTINNGEDLTNYNITDDEIKIAVTFTGSCTITNIKLQVNTRKLDNNSGVELSSSQISGLSHWQSQIEEDIENIVVNTNSIGDNSVTTSKIANGTIIDEDISSSANINLSKIADDNIQTLASKKDDILTVNQYGFKNTNLMLTVLKWRSISVSQLQNSFTIVNVLPIAPKNVIGLWSENARQTSDRALINTGANWYVSNNNKDVSFRIYQDSIHTFAWDFFHVEYKIKYKRSCFILTNTIFHGIIIRKEGIQYKVNLDTGTQISYVANATSFNVDIGDRVVVSFIGYNNKPVITNVYNKTNNGDIDCRSVEKIIKISTSGLIDTYKIDYNKPPLESFFHSY